MVDYQRWAESLLYYFVAYFDFDEFMKEKR